MSENTSGVIPCGHRILVRPIIVEEKSESGIILRTTALKDREQMAQTEGVIIALGQTVWHDQDAPWAAVGDHVIFSKFSGIVVPGADEVEYRVINDLDVIGIKKGDK